MKRLRFDQLITCFGICVIFLIPSKAVVADAIQSHPLNLVPIAPIPVLIHSSALATESFMASLSAHAVLVIDVPSAAILAAKNSEEPAAPASTTKMLTALVAYDLYSPDEVVTIREEAFTVGHTVGFALNEQLTVRNLLASLLIDSGNDAAFALADHHPQGYDGFIAAMNQKAGELHLSHSSFRNPSGLDDAAHFSTARDLGVVAREILKNPDLSKLVATKKMVITDITGAHKHVLQNTNELLYTEPGIIGVKTGTTELAKESLVTAVDRKGHRLLLVVLGSDDRYKDTQLLLHWAESQYEWVPAEPSKLELEKPQ